MPYFKEDIFVCADDNFMKTVLPCMLIQKAIKVDKDTAEKSALFTRLASYTIIFNTSARKVFVVQKKTGNNGLHKTFSLGIEINIRESDVYPFENNAAVNCAMRSLRENFYIRNKKLDVKPVGYAYDIRTDMSCLGIIYYMITGSASVIEKDKYDGKWISYEKLVGTFYFKLDSWSKNILDYIYEDIGYRKIFNF